MASPVSSIASLRELAFKAVLETGNQDYQDPEIRAVAQQILDEVFPLQNIRRTIPLRETKGVSPALFARNTPEHRVRSLFQIVRRIFPSVSSSSESLASMIERIGRGSGYTNIVDQEGQLRSLPNAVIAQTERSNTLARAARNNWDPDIVSLLLATGPVSESLAFHCAVTNGNFEIVRRLLNLGISEENRASALCTSAAQGRLELVRLLLDSGLSEAKRGVALRVAASNGHLEVLRELLNSGISEKDRGDGLYHAAEKGDLEIVRELLNSGISKKDRIRALGEAACRWNSELVRLLDSNISEESRETALYHAAEKGDLAKVRELLNSEISEKDRVIALHYAAHHEHLEIVQELLKSGISEELRGDVLWKAAIKGRFEIFRELLNSGISEGRRGCFLFLAAREGLFEIVQELLKSGISEADIGLALREAVRHKHLEIVRELLKSGISEENRRLALELASERGYSEVVRLLDSSISEDRENALAGAGNGHPAVVRNCSRQQDVLSAPLDVNVQDPELPGRMQVSSSNQALLNALLDDNEQILEPTVPVRHSFEIVRSLLTNQPISEQERQIAVVSLALAIMTAAIVYYIQSCLASER